MQRKDKMKETQRKRHVAIWQTQNMRAECCDFFKKLKLSYWSYATNLVLFSLLLKWQQTFHYMRFTTSVVTIFSLYDYHHRIYHSVFQVLFKIKPIQFSLHVTHRPITTANRDTIAAVLLKCDKYIEGTSDCTTLKFSHSTSLTRSAHLWWICEKCQLFEWVDKPRDHS